MDEEHEVYGGETPRGGRRDGTPRRRRRHGRGRRRGCAAKLQELDKMKKRRLKEMEADREIGAAAQDPAAANQSSLEEVDSQSDFVDVATLNRYILSNVDYACAPEV